MSVDFSNFQYDQTVSPHVSSDPYEALPPGRYEGQIINQETRPDKNGFQRLWLEFSVKYNGGTKNFRDSYATDRNNPNVKAVAIGYEQIERIANALGLTINRDKSGYKLIRSSEELSFKPFYMTTRNEVSGQYTNTRIVKVEPLSSPAAPHQQRPTTMSSGWQQGAQQGHGPSPRAPQSGQAPAQPSQAGPWATGPQRQNQSAEDPAWGQAAQAFDDQIPY